MPPEPFLCPRCKSSLPAQAEFCPHCGADITGLHHPEQLLHNLRPGAEEPAPAAPPVGVAGKRVVTFVFVLIAVLFTLLTILILLLHKPTVGPAPYRDPGRPMFSR